MPIKYPLSPLPPTKFTPLALQRQLLRKNYKLIIIFLIANRIMKNFIVIKDMVVDILYTNNQDSGCFRPKL